VRPASAMNDLPAFEEFRRSRSPDSMIALLRAHQDGIYRVCLHVLEHPQDAEDAAQVALIKIAAGAGDLSEPRAFKSWLYRLVYRTAVDHLRRRQVRRRNEKERPAVPDPAQSEAARAAVHEAMARLPDGDRLLLVEHYFENTPLEELGRREGVTRVAIWKRIELARERLKRGLAGAGFALGPLSVLESVPQVSAPPGLIGSAIVAKAALAAAGGLAVGTKSYSMGIVIGAAMVFLVLGAGSGYWVGAKRAASRNHQAGFPSVRTVAGNSQDRPANRFGGIATPGEQTPAASPELGRGDSPSKPNPAAERLAQFKKWHEDWKAEKWETQAEYAEHQRKLVEQGPELRRILLKDVDAILDFARDPENAGCLGSLFSAALKQWVFQSNGQWAITGRAFSDEDIPPELTAGLLETLSKGSEDQKLALFSLGDGFDKPPEALLSEYRKYLGDSSSQLLLAATWGLRRSRSITRDDLEVMKRNAETSPFVGVRSESYKAVAAARTPEAIDWVFSQLHSQADARSTSIIASALREEIYLHDPIPKQVEPKAAEAVLSALRRDVDDHAYESLLYFGLCLSTDYTGRVLEVAVTRAPTETLRRATERILESFRNGERNSQRLWVEYFRSKK
jgi:RNA polymerase sigma factor (sigma-70 family)